MRNEPCGCTEHWMCEPCFRDEGHGGLRRDFQREEDEATYRALVEEPTVEWLNRG